MTTKKILADLKRQDKINGVTDDTVLLRKVLVMLNTEEEWRVFADVSWHKYGKMSYQSRRFWHPSALLMRLIEFQG